jgi:murein DD-endopeptidase MepM/ murein hydrolase activator NlpD
MLESISVDPITGQHTITTVSSNVDGELLAYWDSTLKQFSGTWSSMASSGFSDSGSFIGSQQGIANSSSFDAVLGLLTTFADGVEGETLIASDIFSAAYLNDGFNASDWDSRLSSWFSNYDFLQVEIGEVTTLITHNNGDENLWTRRLPQIEASIVVTGTNIATGAVETVYEFSPSAINTELSLLEATPVAKFIGNGASSDFEILLPLNKVDAAIGTSNVVWPFGVHGGGHPEGHPGADFWMAPGSPILAAAGGEVVMLDSSMLMIECRSGLLLQYEHLKNIDATLSIGTTVSAGQHLAEPEVDHFHFAIRHGIVLAPPLEYFTSAAQVDFDYLWENSQWPQEISEPLITNDMHIEFPHVVSWLNTDPAGSPAVIELTDTSPFDYVHTYRLLDSTGAVIDSGTADYNHMNGTLNFGAQYGLVDIVGPEMTLELSTSAPPTAFVSPSTFLFAE